MTDELKQKIKRIENFDSGDFNCIKCGKKFHLYFNGGELDQHICCGILYRTESPQVDLVIYEPRE